LGVPWRAQLVASRPGRPLRRKAGMVRDLPPHFKPGSGFAFYLSVH